MPAEAWRELAACKTADGSHDPNFWPEIGAKASMRAAAKGKCFVCPVRSECLDWALTIEGDADANHRYAILGGLDPAERAAEHRTRRYEQALKEKEGKE